MFWTFLLSQFCVSGVCLCPCLVQEIPSDTGSALSLFSVSSKVRAVALLFGNSSISWKLRLSTATQWGEHVEIMQSSPSNQRFEKLPEQFSLPHLFSDLFWVKSGIFALTTINLNYFDIFFIISAARSFCLLIMGSEIISWSTRWQFGRSPSMQ